MNNLKVDKKMTTSQSYPLGEHIQMTSTRVPSDGHQQKAKHSID
jgi:hypothetical protein